MKKKNTFFSLILLQIVVLILKYNDVPPFGKWSYVGVWGFLMIPLSISIVVALVANYLKGSSKNEKK